MDEAKLISLKLFVDKDKNRVVFAESRSDFVDVLFSILTLPMGTIVRMLNKRSLVGCMDRLYESVERLDLPFMETNACKTMLLRPRRAAEWVCGDLKLVIDDIKPRTIYVCPTWDSCMVYSPVEDAKCPKCRRDMKKEFFWRKGGAKEDRVFVAREGSFIVTDDLRVIPATTDAILSVLHRFDVSDSTVLEERTMEIGVEEVLSLLKRSLISETPLTDALLREPDHMTRDPSDMVAVEKNRAPAHVFKCAHAATSTTGGDRRLTMKLILSKSMDTLLYAEAGGTVVDLLFSFLTFPLGSMVKLLDRRSGMGCADNLYRSVEEQIKTGGMSACSDVCTVGLLSPPLAPYSACKSQLLSIDGAPLRSWKTLRCDDCRNQQFTAAGTKCLHGIEHAVLSAIDPKQLPVDSGTGRSTAGGGFTKEGESFMITDELEVTPLSSSSSISAAGKLGIPISDLVVREVSLGETEALRILKASLVSKRALSSVFCPSKPRKTSLLREPVTGSNDLCGCLSFWTSLMFRDV